MASFRNIYTSLMLVIAKSTDKELARQVSCNPRSSHARDGLNDAPCRLPYRRIFMWPLGCKG
jgi:hypothetical protein